MLMITGTDALSLVPLSAASLPCVPTFSRDICYNRQTEPLGRRTTVDVPSTAQDHPKKNNRKPSHTYTRGIWRGLGPGVCWGTCKAGPNSGHNARAQPKKAGFTYCPQRVPQSGSVRKGGKVREKVGTAHPRLSSQEPFLAALCTPSHSGRGRAKSWMYRTPTNKNHEDPQTPRLQPTHGHKRGMNPWTPPPPRTI